MKCQQCGSENKGGQIYCHICGAELDLTYDQIHDGVVDELVEEKQKFTEDQTRQFLVLAVFLLILAITLVSLAGPVPIEESPPTFHAPNAVVQTAPKSPVRPFTIERVQFENR